MEEAHSKDDLPPVPAQGVLLKEVVGDLGEGSPDVGSETLGRLIRHLVACDTAETNRRSEEPEAETCFLRRNHILLVPKGDVYIFSFSYCCIFYTPELCKHLMFSSVYFKHRLFLTLGFIPVHVWFF